METEEHPVDSTNLSDFTNIDHTVLIPCLFVGLTLILLLIKYSKMSGSVGPPPRQQLYREPAPPAEGFWTKWPRNECKLAEPSFEGYNGLMPISVNWQLTETIVTNSHVFVAFTLPRPYCDSSHSLIDILAQVVDALRNCGDEIRRIVVNANCSSDSSMAIKHKVNQYPTIAYYRNGYYYCDYYGDKTSADLFEFFVSTVTFDFPQRQH